MAGYVAMARIDGARVRALPVPDGAVAWTPAPVVASDDATATIDEGDATPFAERLERIREQLAMTTFFLFDANSWR
jgi:hypothetical protein